ncbi:PREDICTED: T-box transcription factor TBX22-like [Nanorana parkeri]|uniref:T-box transcription factor TBX22-like n=1 Tax=Nanorana parkeri TaxID=125878 RepID=UPI00085482B7|nr:PREDICTED: T-box transcription factor TBX22-like [Nanorana parkeri]
MALSTRARSFSVEALVGKRKLEEPGATVDKKGATQQLRNPGTEEEPEKRSKSAAPLSPACPAPPHVQVDLQGGDLWRRFHEIGTEMIITKAGRRMFPSVRVKVKGLDPDKQYYIAMDIIPVDSKRYRYVYHSSQWMVAGNTDHSCITPRLYIHPDSPCSGETWMRQIISFDRVKLTNNEMDDKGHIILQSMHKYEPRVHVIVRDSRFELSQIQSLPAEGVKTFSFKETEFTTVTAYQNQQITKLKIDRNPFAKGFRDPGRNRGVLDGLLESYPWRPALAIDFKALTETTGERSPPIDTPSPPGPRSALFPGADKQACPGGPLLSPLTLDVPLLSAFSISKPDRLETAKSARVPALSPAAHMLYGLPVSGNVLPSARESLHCSVHPSYGFYNLAVPPHFIAANQYKMADAFTASHIDGRPNGSRWPPPLNHCLPRSALFPGADKQACPGGPLLSPLTLDVPLLSAFSISKPDRLETAKSARVPALSPAAHMLYGLPVSGNVLPSARESLHCSVHPSYGFYNLAVPPHFIAANQYKMADAFTASHIDGRPNGSRWPPPLNHCL